MSVIQYVAAREILDSRGIPTLECQIWLDTGEYVTSSVPSGTSVGKYEAVTLRDNDQTHMRGQGVLQAVQNIETVIGPQIVGKDPTKQQEIDNLMISLDGTKNKSKLGANAILVVSQTVLKAGAASQNMSLYQYVFHTFQACKMPVIPNMIYALISGGAHGASNLDIQEFQVIPATHTSFSDSLNMAVTLFHKLEEVLVSKEAIHSVGIVGGFTPNLYSNSDAFEILLEAIKSTAYTYAQHVFMGVDMAAEQFYEGNKYHLKENKEAFSSAELTEYYLKIRKLYHVFYIEDPFSEDDVDSWKQLQAELGETTTIVGDSLIATNKERLQNAIENKLCNAVLIKPTQVGTISETIDVVKTARSAGWQIVVSHRSGETNDDLIADLAVGVGAEYVKFGPPNRGERVAKYNRLLEIQSQLAQENTTTQTSPQISFPQESAPEQAPVAPVTIETAAPQPSPINQPVVPTIAATQPQTTPQPEAAIPEPQAAPAPVTVPVSAQTLPSVPGSNTPQS